MCDNGGWRNYTRQNDSTFKNEGACVSYAAQGAALKPASTGGTTGTGTFNGTLANDPAAHQPWIYGDGTCDWPNGDIYLSPYKAHSVTLGETSTLTITAQGAGSGNGTLLDPELAFYAGAFDPNDTCGSNLLAVGADAGSSRDAAMVVGPLAPGNYTVVVFSYYTQRYAGEGYEAGTYKLTISAT